MQKAETGLLDSETKQKEEKAKPVKLIEIAVDEAKKIYINWPADKKELCIIALAEAIKLVETYQKPIIEKPKPHILDFVRGLKR